MKDRKPIESIYIHIPFCKRKCNYCSFNSVKYDSALVDAYIDAIGNEIDLISDKYAFKTIYLGGGTPTVLNSNQLRRLLNLINRSIYSSKVVEYTVEANPGTLNNEKISILKENLVNRISLGVQSFNDAHLRTLSRIHTNLQTVQTYALLRENGFNNINIDLIFGIPSQNIKEWKDDLHFAISLDPEHISTYSLTYEDGTVFKELIQRGGLQKIAESNALDMYKLAIGELTRSGFTHYEISNFAKKEKSSLHNIVYWKNQGYVGIGAGACSFVSGRRSSNETDVKQYIQNVSKNLTNTISYECLPPEEHAAETIIMGLRMLAGISNNRFQEQTGYILSDMYSKQISVLKKAGYLSLTDNRLRLTEKGLYVADSVMMEFLN